MVTPPGISQEQWGARLAQILNGARPISVMAKNTENGWNKIGQAQKTKLNRVGKDELKQRCGAYQDAPEQKASWFRVSRGRPASRRPARPARPPPRPRENPRPL